jgi:hypothetical protein
VIGDYFNDPIFRDNFQQWLNQRWQRKDQQIELYLQQNQHSLQSAPLSQN